MAVSGSKAPLESQAITDPGRRRRKDFIRLLRTTRTAWLYILPAGILMLIITVFPQGFQAWMSFTNFRIQNLRFNIFDPATWEKFAPTMVGLQNYYKILTSQLALENYNFIRMLSFNFIWAISNVFFHVTLGVLIALALNSKKVYGRRFYRALYILPWAIPGYITALTWRNMYDQRFGAVNLFLARMNEIFGTSLPTDTAWLTVTHTSGILDFLPVAFWAVLVSNIWLGWPFMTVVATGALQSIPAALYEAADIDGASGWQKFWSVTVPMIRPAMVPAIMLGTIWTFNQFAVIYFISNGGPFGKTEILITQAFKLVFEQRIYGVAAAFSFVVFFVLLIITLVNNRVTRATEAYNV